MGSSFIGPAPQLGTPEWRVVQLDETKRYTPYLSNFRVARTSFWGAGQDSFTLPPTQNEDLFAALTNIQPVMRGVLERRWGYQLFSTVSATTQPLTRMFSYQRDTDLARRILVANFAIPNVNAYALNEDGSFFSNVLAFTAAGSAPARAVTSRDFAFFTGPATPQKWGGISKTLSVSVANNGAGSVSGTNSWQITLLAATGQESLSLQTTSLASSSNTVTIASPAVQLGVTKYRVYANGHLQATTNIGTATNVAGPLDTTAIASPAVDGLITSQWGMPMFASLPPTFVNAGAGNVTLSVGRKYFYVYQNSITGHYSDLSAVSVSTGAVNNSKFTVSIPAPGSTNSNVNVSQTDRPSAQTNPDVTYSGQAFLNPANAYDGNLTSYAQASDGASGDGVIQQAPNNTVTQTSSCEWHGFGAITGTVTALTLYVAGLSQYFPSGGQAVGNSSAQVEYSLDNGSTWNTLWNSPSHTYAIDSVALATSQDPTLVRVRAHATSLGTTDFSAARTQIHINEVYLVATTTVSSSSGGEFPDQVDRVVLLATADGGDETLLFLVDSAAVKPRGTVSAPVPITDNLSEPVLEVSNVFLETDAFGNTLGVADNDAPLATFTLTNKHRGRIFAVNGQFLYFTKSLEELTTSTGLIAGRYEECWPPFYYLDISEGAENIRGILSDGITQYVATEKRIRRLVGDGPGPFGTPFAKPEVLFNDVGVVNQECWQVVFREGTPVGAIWLTPDFRVIHSDMNTYRDIGHPIQDVLNTISQTYSSTSSASFAAAGGYDLYLLAVPTGTNVYPDTVPVYNLRTGHWVIWLPTDKIAAQLYNINKGGVPQFLFSSASTNTKVYQFLAGLTQDRALDTTPVGYACTAKTSWLTAGDSTLRKALNELEVITDDTASLQVTIEGANTEADFSSPVTVVASAALVTGPFGGEQKVFLAGFLTKYRYYRLTLYSPSSSTAANLVQALTLEAVPIHRV